MLALTRFLLFCIAVLAFPAVSAAQTPPHLDSGWYRNDRPAIICENCSGLTLKIVWENSYIYQYPGTDPLYWYAQILYTNTGSKTLDIVCDTNPDPSAVRENMSGTPNAGYVAAEETFCSRNPGRIVSLKPGKALDDWAIFHNVPWRGGKVSLQDDYYGSSESVDPWASRYPAGAIPPPAECPPELETLGTCLPVLRQPRGKDSTADNLIVIVHGCCTSPDDVEKDWDSLGRAIGAEILRDQPPGTWEIVVKDWTTSTTKPQDLKDLLIEAVFQQHAKRAYDAALTEGNSLANTIAEHQYNFVHLIAHSAGARLIDQAAQMLSLKSATPFTYLTFLDAYTPSGDLYGLYADYAEHYVDRHLKYTDDCLSNAFNFDISNWPHTLGEGYPFGHHWPRYWYAKSITTFKYGYPLSLEGSGTTIDTLPMYRRGQQCPLNPLNGEDIECQPAACWQ